jgi:hypothetical protein
MTASELSSRNLALLKDPVFDLPKARPPGNFGDFREETFDAFFQRLQTFEEPFASVLHARGDRMQSLSAAVVAAWRFTWEGTGPPPIHLAAGVRGVREELISMSRRHSIRVLPGQCWYRLAAWNGVEERKHMFHTPFELPPKSYRFSTSGAPTLYLANSVYLCWLECGEPGIDDCFVSRFEVDAEGFEFLDVPCNHQAYVIRLDFLDIARSAQECLYRIRPRPQVSFRGLLVLARAQDRAARMESNRRSDRKRCAHDFRDHRKGCLMAGAAIVLMTPDDEARLRDHFRQEHDPSYEKQLTPQPRPNVIFEAGLAMAKFRDKTVLVRAGPIRQFSDISGMTC